MNPTATWQKSSYCGTGESCIHLAPAPDGAVRLTESSDPSGAVLTLTPSTWRAWRAAIKGGRMPETGAEASPGGVLRLRADGGDGDGTVVVTTTTAQWEAFAAGVRAGEFDRLAG